MKKILSFVLLIAIVFSVNANMQITADAASSRLEKARKSAEEIIPNFDMKLYLHKLNADELYDFIALYESYLNFEETCVLPYPLKPDDYFNVHAYLSFDCPELLMFSSDAYTYYYNTIDGEKMVTAVILPYEMDEEEYNYCKKIVDANISYINAPTAGLSKIEKEKYVYDYIITVNSYDMYSENCANAYGCLVEGRAKCEGIAKTAKLMLDELGIKNFIIRGKRDNENAWHLWNAVKIGDEFYQLDITHDDLDTELSDGTIIHPYGLFNVSTKYLSGSYDEIDDACKPLMNKLSSSNKKSYSYKNNMYCEKDENGADKLSEILWNKVPYYEQDMMIQFAKYSEYKDTVDSLENGYLSNWLNSYGVATYYNYYWMNESRTIYIHIQYV